MTSVIVIIGALDTKGAELLYLKEQIDKRGKTPILIDVSCKPHRYEMSEADVTCYQVAEAAGSTMTKVSVSARRDAASVMAQGASLIVEKLYRENRLHGIVGLGGSVGTEIATRAMRALPLGVPKLCISTIQNTAPYVGTKDVMMLYPVVDLAGGQYVNRVERKVLTNAANAITGMVEGEAPSGEDKPLVAASMIGVTTPCVQAAKLFLEARGYEVVVFHANGAGGVALEEMVRNGSIVGVLDITTHELADELVGGVGSAGPKRLEAAGEAGIPQVLCPGGLELAMFHTLDSIPSKFRRRHFFRHSESFTLMRLTRNEITKLGEIMANKVNNTTAPTAVVVPLKGWSAYDQVDGPFCCDSMGKTASFKWHDPGTSEAFLASLEKQMDISRSNLEVLKVDVHINDPEFASMVAQILLEMLDGKWKRGNIGSSRLSA
jgi:uncharacterized protein (UPF0261 family)